MKKFLITLLVLVVLVVGGLLAAPFLIPMDTYKQQVQAQVERATGRKLAIDGPFKLTLLPSLGVTMAEVRLADRPGAAEPDMVTLDTLEVALKPLPLLRGAVEIDRFVLRRPVIRLTVDQQGQPNWQFDAAGQSPSEAAEPAGKGGGGLPLTDLKLGDIRIEDGQLTYQDQATGRTEQLDAINLQVALPDLQSPLQATGAVTYKGKPIDLTVDLAAPAQLIQGASSPLALKLAAAPVALDFTGELANGAQPGATGKVDLKVPAIRDLAAWLAEPIALEGEGLQRLAIAGQLAASAERVAFTEATVALDAIEGRGEVAAKLAGAKPKVTGQLALGRVDLNPYLPPPAQAAAAPAQGEGAAAASGWSDEPIALPLPTDLDVAFELTVDSLQLRKLQLERTKLGLNLEGGTLALALNEMALYGGRGSGVLTVSQAGGRPQIAQQFKLAGLQAQPFLAAAADFERLEGTVDAELDVTTSGASQRQLVEALGGTGRAMFKDGAITGINLAAMVRNVGNAFLDPSAGEARKTDFAELGGSFRITRGILSNQDMILQAPVLRVAGSGTVDLPARRLDYRIEPKAAATLEGQGGAQDVAGLLVPVIIKGPWDQLSYAPDLSGVLDAALKDPAKLKEQAKQLGKTPEQVRQQLKQLEDQAKAGGAEAVVKGLSGALGGGREPEPAAGPKPAGAKQPGAKQPEDAAKDLLKGLFAK